MPVDLSTAEPADVRTAPTPQGHEALVREVALVHARARAAEYLVREDPVAAARALRGLTVSSGAVWDALRTGAPAPRTGAVVVTDLLGAFRAAGGSVHLVATGPERRLTPDGAAAVRALVEEVLAAGVDAAGSLSVALTWSTAHLDVLLVLGPSADPSAAEPVTAADLLRSAGAVLAAGGTLRVETPAAGGTVVAASLPVPAPARAAIAG
ncbi:hypothetical protein [Geodermatophilus sp. FMUSA9-8]|uniref:hypothetical protein n=1 Tax=Geodermatophilus sp. FMUSA9-8 TaxID=3120155 RepID=UPI00300A5BF3